MDIETRIKKEFIVYYSLFMLICSVLGYAFFHIYAPESIFHAYLLIPAFFYLYGIVYISLFAYLERYMPDKTAQFYLIQKGAKLFLSITVLLLYKHISADHNRAFMLTFMAFYFLTMGFEGWFFSRIETIKKLIDRANKRKKRRKRRLEKHENKDAHTNL